MSDDFIRVRLCEGGETVTDGKAKTACNYCSNGVCRQMQACEVPVQVLAAPAAQQDVEEQR